MSLSKNFTDTPFSLSSPCLRLILDSDSHRKENIVLTGSTVPCTKLSAFFKRDSVAANLSAVVSTGCRFTPVPVPANQTCISFVLPHK